MNVILSRQLFFAGSLLLVLLADLAIAPLPKSACEGNLVDVGATYDLPELTNYKLGMLHTGTMSPPAEAVADHLRAYFTGLAE